MFESFYGLTANPFRLTVDERFRYAHKTYVKAWSYLKYALEQGEGFVLITGRPGTGKTTLIRDMLSELDSSKLLAVHLVTNQFQSEELLRMVALGFGFQAQDFNKATLLTKIEDYAAQLHAEGRRVIILVDEAQNLTENGLEELRLLSNLQIGNKPLFQIFLIGQEELRGLIYGRGLENIQQRILAASRVEPMDERQVEGYIEHRLGIVGWHEDPCFEEGVFPLIQKLTKGIPREVNNIMGRLLLYGALEEKHLLTMDDLRIVAQELNRESRTDFDIEESWSSYEEGLPGAEEAKREAEQPGNGSRIPERSGEVAAEHGEPSVPPPSDTAATAESSGPHDQGAQSGDGLGCRERRALLHDGLFGEGGEDDSGACGFADADLRDSDLELPSILIDEDAGARPYSRRLDDVDDSLDEGVAVTRIERRWRWFFYPGALLILAFALWMSGTEELRLLWRDTLRYLGVTQTDVEPASAPVAEPRTLQQDREILPVLREQPAPDVVDAEAEDQRQPSFPAPPPRRHPAQAQMEQPLLSQPDLVPQSPLTLPEQLPVPGEQTAPAQVEQASLSRSEPPDVVADAEAEAGSETEAAIIPGRSYFIALGRESGEPLVISLDTLASVLEFVENNPKALVVVTGFIQGETAPLEQMREALRSAERLADYFVGHGLSRQQISIEGGVPEESSTGGETLAGETGEEAYDRIRLRVILLRGGDTTSTS